MRDLNFIQLLTLAQLHHRMSAASKSRYIEQMTDDSTRALAVHLVDGTWPTDPDDKLTLADAILIAHAGVTL